MGVFEPGFDVVDLLESEPESTDSESVMLTCREPVRVHVLDWRATDLCSVTADDEVLPLYVAEGPAGAASGPTRYTLRKAIDVEGFSGARVDLRIETSDLERDVTLSGEDIEPGEFTLEDELRVATATGSASRLRRVLPFFLGDGDFVLPKLGELDAASRRRMDLGREFEKPDGWKPVLVDFVEAADSENDELVPRQFWRTAGSEPGLPTGHGADRRVRRSACAVFQVPRHRHPDGEELRPGVRYAVGATSLCCRAKPRGAQRRDYRDRDLALPRSILGDLEPAPGR